MKRFISTALLFNLTLLFIPSSLAHDFWLTPNAFQLSEPNKVSVQFMVGHHADLGHWDLQWKRIVALRSISEDGWSDMSATVVPKSTLMPGTARTKMLDTGTHVIAFESYHSTSELEAEKFNDYVANEGLTAIANHRSHKGQQQQNGTEIYSRKAKAIVQVGDQLTENALKPVGHTLEIVPLSHPYKLSDNGELPISVLFRGRPLSGATVDLSSLDDDASDQSKVTDANGTTSFVLDSAKNYRLNVVWGVPIRGIRDADFETYFSSLTLGYKQ